MGVSAGGEIGALENITVVGRISRGQAMYRLGEGELQSVFCATTPNPLIFLH